VGFGLILWAVFGQDPAPHDPRLLIEKFAEAPHIVHPIGIEFDARGRLLAIESHTHFPPKGYAGMAHDRILALEDADGDGRADRVTPFFEGTKKTMDIARRHDGAILIATRNEILRLIDADADGVAERAERVVFLDTKGDYPHNGLSGLALDFTGDLYFGMGENLGEPYTLIGADGTKIADAGEGGNVFWCTADGRKLRRVATGFWNPFGVCLDIFGRIFATDNDPDGRPPCRLIHVVEGGDYGYQFRYGRSGQHPFQAWNGELPGTLPMVAGVGEGPCEVISYESDGLPAEYAGNLLVASWADHRIERYRPAPRGASFGATREPFVTGPEDFRPVGLAVAPDGSLYVSDWVKRDYELHGRGAIWRVRLRERGLVERPGEPERAIASPHRPLREEAARRMASSSALLYVLPEEGDPRAAAAALAALIARGDAAACAAVADFHPNAALAAMAARAMGPEASRFFDERRPAEVRLAAIGRIADPEVLLKLLAHEDPFFRSAARRRLAQLPELLESIEASKLSDPAQRIGLMLACREAGQPVAEKVLPTFLRDRDADVRFLAVKWVADRQVRACRGEVEAIQARPQISPRMFMACATALARLDERKAGDHELYAQFFAALMDAGRAPALRAMALRLLPAGYPPLKLGHLKQLLAAEDPALRLEAVRSLGEFGDPGVVPHLVRVARDEEAPSELRAWAVVGLAPWATEAAADLAALAEASDEAVRAEARRVSRGHPPAHPADEDLNAWMRILEKPGDAAAGRRIFFNPTMGACSRCHTSEGRGRGVGPDLTSIGAGGDPRAVLESILLPNRQVAPRFSTWLIRTKDGQVRVGFLIGTTYDENTYVAGDGGTFKVRATEVAESREQPISIMPERLLAPFTDQEVRDLMAYLMRPAGEP
jgi:putative membrane-bound dehydrogenase-like protein